MLAQRPDRLTHRSAKRSSSSSSGSVIFGVSRIRDLVSNDVRKPLSQPDSNAELLAYVTASSRALVPVDTQ